MTNGVLYQRLVVNANRFFEKFDVVGNYIYSFSSLVDSLFTPYPNSSVALPPENGLYEVRGVGMRLYSPEAHNFVSKIRWLEESINGRASAIANSLEELVLQMARDNRSWGYKRIVGVLENFELLHRARKRTTGFQLHVA